MTKGRIGIDLFLAACVVILWHTTGLSWLVLVMLFVAATIANNVERIVRMQRAFERIRRNLHNDLSAEMEVARKRELAKVRNSLKDDQGRTVN